MYAMIGQTGEILSIFYTLLSMDNIANLFEDAINKLKELDRINEERIKAKLARIKQITEELEALETIENKRNKLEKLYKL